jgi:hypothetical protein
MRWDNPITSYEIIYFIEIFHGMEWEVTLISPKTVQVEGVGESKTFITHPHPPSPTPTPIRPSLVTLTITETKCIKNRQTFFFIYIDSILCIFLIYFKMVY